MTEPTTKYQHRGQPLLYFSQSRKEFVALESMNVVHLKNALRRMTHNEEGEPYGDLSESAQALADAMAQEIASRPAPEVAPAVDSDAEFA